MLSCNFRRFVHSSTLDQVIDPTVYSRSDRSVRGRRTPMCHSFFDQNVIPQTFDDLTINGLNYLV